MYDASKGGKILTLINVPSGVVIPAPDGSILVYSLTPDANGYALSLWNSTQAINIDNNHDPGLSNDYWEWRPYYWQTDPYANGVVNAAGTTAYPTTNARIPTNHRTTEYKRNNVDCTRTKLSSRINPEPRI